MCYTPSILAFSGSLAKESYNTKLVKIAANGARKAGAEVTIMELRDLPLPLYNRDLEATEGLPANCLKLKDVMKASDGFLIGSPEHNSSYTPALKNAIDWASRPREGETPLECFKGKIAGIMSASPGGLGGLRGLVHIRDVLENIHTLVITEQKAISSAQEVFDTAGNLKNAKDQEAVEHIGSQVALMIAKLKG